jgi:hypothetical protein
VSSLTTFTTAPHRGQSSISLRRRGERQASSHRHSFPAAPSLGLNRSYEFIQGTIDDLTSLPVMRATAAPSIVPDSDSPRFADLSRAVQGVRDRSIWPYIARQAHLARSLEGLFDQAKELNELMQPPMTDAEIIAKCKYWWDKTVTGENRFGIGQHVVIDHALIDGLMCRDLDAYGVLSMLMRHHWGRNFYFSNAKGETMGGWGHIRLAAARKTLIEEGFVTVIHPATRHEPMLCRLSDKVRWLRGKR